MNRGCASFFYNRLKIIIIKKDIFTQSPMRVFSTYLQPRHGRLHEVLAGVVQNLLGLLPQLVPGEPVELELDVLRREDGLGRRSRLSLFPGQCRSRWRRGGGGLGGDQLAQANLGSVVLTRDFGLDFILE